MPTDIDGTDERAGSSTGNPPGSRGRGQRFVHRSKPKLVGNIPELGSSVFTYNTPNQAEQYLRAKEDCGDHVGSEFSGDMRRLVKNLEERTFTYPKVPTGRDVGPAVIADYKMDKSRIQADEKKYKEDKSQVFSILVGQCSSAMIAKLKGDSAFQGLEKNDDVVGLLKKLKSLAFSTGGEQHPSMILRNTLHKVSCMSQGPKETPANYHRRFVANIDVLESLWGDFTPTKTTPNTAAEKTKQRTQLQVMLFLSGADPARYKQLINELNNQYLAKTDNYPASLDAALDLLSHYHAREDTKPRARRDDTATEAITETSFAQDRRSPHARCPLCDGRGHSATVCPNNRNRRRQNRRLSRQTARGSTNAQTHDEVGSDDEGVGWAG